MKDDNPKRGFLSEAEPHPAAEIARDFLMNINLSEWIEPLASCAIEGNRMAEICSETLKRILNREPVSDRYLMGLAWALFKMTDGDRRFQKNPYRRVLDHENRRYIDNRRENAYGTVVMKNFSGKDLPAICGHGGSMWLCLDCAEHMIKAGFSLKKPCPFHSGPGPYSCGCTWPGCNLNIREFTLKKGVE